MLVRLSSYVNLRGEYILYMRYVSETCVNMIYIRGGFSCVSRNTHTTASSDCIYVRKFGIWTLWRCFWRAPLLYHICEPRRAAPCDTACSMCPYGRLTRRVCWNHEREWVWFNYFMYLFAVAARVLEQILSKLNAYISCA